MRPGAPASTLVAAVLLCVAGPGAGRPRGGDKGALRCETCQLLATQLHEAVLDRLDRSTDRSFRLAAAVEGALGEADLCRHFREKGGEMEAFAQRAGLGGGEMALECGRQLADFFDDFEAALRRAASEGASAGGAADAAAAAVREAVCLKKRGKRKRALCDEGLWSESRAPMAASRARREARLEGEAAAASGAEFLRENGARDGVVQLKRGLQYKVLRPGAGSIRPGSEDICTVHYRGSTIDCEIQSGPEPCRGGFVFDDSWEKGRNVTFTPKSAGSFWALALPLMVRGALWELYVPQVLGFAGNDNPDRRPRGVGPNATLIFKVELLAIKGKDDAPLGEGRDPEAGPGVEL